MNLYELADLIGMSLASFVSGNNQPCMSGDPRDRIPAGRRSQYDEACRDLALSILTAAEQTEPAPMYGDDQEVYTDQDGKVWHPHRGYWCWKVSHELAQAQKRIKELEAEPAADAEPFAYFYRYSDPMTGKAVWRSNSGLWNGQRPAEILPLYTRPPESRLREALEHVTELLVDTWNMKMEGDPERQMAVRDARAALAQEDGR